MKPKDTQVTTNRTQVQSTSKAVVPNKDTRFWIHPDDFNLIIQYAKSAYNQFKSEIGGQLIILPDDDGDFILSNPVILKQVISAGNCTMDAKALAIHYAQMASTYGRNARNCWWHSHHTMAAFWSGTDDATILDGKSKDWTVSLVVNLKKEYKLRVQFFEPFVHDVDVEINFLSVDSEDNKLIDDKVRSLCDKEALVHNYSPNVKQGRQLSMHRGFGAGGYSAEPSLYPYSDQWGSVYDNEEPKAYYNAFFQENVPLNKVPTATMNSINDEVITLVDDSSLLNEASASKKYNKEIIKLNRRLQPYNLKMRDFDATELDNALISYWTEDYYEEIHKQVELLDGVPL